MPYMPELPRPFEAIINYNHSVYKIHGIHTTPAGLESTCLVLCYGLGTCCLNPDLVVFQKLLSVKIKKKSEISIEVQDSFGIFLENSPKIVLH